MEQIKLHTFIQDGIEYNLYNLPDGFIIKGDLNLSGSLTTELPNLSEVIVTGDFDCGNSPLKSLKGCPKKVGGNFDCSAAKLKSLEGAPMEVGGVFDCSYNELKSLEGSPRKVGKTFDCSVNKLISLKGAPIEVGGEFDCCENSKLTSLYHVTPNCNMIYCDTKLAQRYGLSRRDIMYEELKESSVFQKEKEQQEKIELQKGHLQERQEYLAERKGEKISSPAETTTHDSNSPTPSKPNGRDDGGR